MKSYKILVTGPFNAGKTTFIKTICGDILSTDRKIGLSEAIKRSTTVALDFGTISLDDETSVRIFGTPGQRRFSFMLEPLAIGMDGYVFMVDSQDPGSLSDAAQMYRFFRENFPNTAHVVAANKSDAKFKISEDVIRQVLEVSMDVPVYPTVAYDRECALSLLRLLVSLIEGKRVLTLK